MDDETLKVWDHEVDASRGHRQEVATLRGHAFWVNACAVTPDAQHVVSASFDCGTFKV